MDIFIAQMQFLQLDEYILLQHTEYQYCVVHVFVIAFVQLLYFLIAVLKKKAKVIV